MVQGVNSSPPTLQALQAQITQVETTRTAELREPLKPPGSWQRFLCALYTRGFGVGERGAKAFEAVASFNGKVLERKQVLEGVRSHLTRLQLQGDLKTAGNIGGILKTGNFWQAVRTLTQSAISGEAEQSAGRERKAQGIAHSKGVISDFLAVTVRGGDNSFMHNFYEACQKAYPAAYETGKLTRTQLEAVFKQVNDAALVQTPGQSGGQDTRNPPWLARLNESRG